MNWLKSISYILKFIGYILTLASLLYLLWVGLNHIPHFPKFDLNWNSIFTLIFLLLLYITTSVVGGITWYWWLQGLKIAIRPLQAISIVLYSQLGKYLPGGIAHHVTRVSLAARCNIPFEKTIITIFMESFVVILSALMVISFSIRFYDSLSSYAFSPYFDTIHDLASLAIWIIFFLAWIFVWIFISPPKWFRKKIVGEEIPNKEEEVHLTLKRWMLFFLLYGYSFVASGVVLYFLVHLIHVNGTLDVPFLTALFTIAWLAGFLAFVAPGGIGVREVVLVYGLQPSMGEANALNVVILLRLLTIAADIGSTALGAALFHKTIKPQRTSVQEI